MQQKHNSAQDRVDEAGTNTAARFRSALTATLVAAFAIGGSASAAPLNDAQVLGIYVQVNGFDIETALLGRSQAGAQGVRQLAAHVSSDHLAVRQAAFDLAEKCKVAPSLPDARVAAAAEHGRTMTTLSALKGADFDRAYLQHEVAFHRAAIDAVRQLLLPAATCPQLQAHFKEILPAFEHHLAMTQELAGAATDR
jgi:putative membrane protein